jgi:ERCC4-related helicase
MTMDTQTVKISTAATIQGVLHDISILSDNGIQRLANYAKRLVEEQEADAMRAEIAALKDKYGTTPNAETIAAIEEARAGLDEPTTLEEILAECHALDKNNQVI